jgi:transcriptional regulator with XRE-family HTH domain
MMGIPPVRQQLAIIEAIAKARSSAGLSQRELSTKLREGPTFMQRIESGSRNVSVLEFIKIARALDADPCDLLRRAL